MRVTPDEFLGDRMLARAVYERVHVMVRTFGDVEVGTSKSQIAFRRRRGFAFLWLPGMYLAKPQAQVVLSIALDRKLTSPRFKEISHPARHVWQHHLEIHDIADVNDEVEGWLRAAYGAAG
jgi:hypothetical protein